MSERRMEAPEALERKLLAAFREHHAWRRTHRRRMWRGFAVAAALAAVLAVISFLRLRPVKTGGAPQPPVTAQNVVNPIFPDSGPPTSPPPRKPRRRKRIEKPAIPVAEPVIRQREVSTGFLPLDASGILPSSGEVIRVEVPRSTMSMFGLPVNDQRLSVPVHADLLLGEDGRAHAVRFVTTTSFQTPSGR